MLTGFLKDQKIAMLLRMLLIFVFVLSFVKINAQTDTPGKRSGMMVRIAEIKIDSAYLKEYMAILKQEAAASLKVEPGVIAIFPMYNQQAPDQIRIMEIYANREAYELHLKTSHFLFYKSATLKMVKSLELVNMEPLDEEMMVNMFKKIK